jgi:O-antigen/teichoic acid export membrane protein
MSSLKEKTVSGLKWTALEQVVSQFLAIAINIVLARILLPQEFGLIAMIAVFTALGNNLMNSGLSTSLIRSKHVDELDYSTVFITNTGMSLLLYVIIYFSAPFVANFYDEPTLIWITRIFAFTIVINAFKTVQIARLTRIMDFKTQMYARLPTLVLSGGLAILAAKNDFGVWSLVVQALTTALSSTLIIWWIAKWKPQFVFNKQKFLYHLNFGYRLAISSVLDAVFSNIYPLIIGKYYPASLVGYYKQADTLAKIPVVSLSNIINKVSLPLYAKQQHNKSSLKNTNKTIVQLVLLLITPVCVFAAITAEDLITLVLTDKWLPAVPYFQLLCFFAIMSPISSYNTQLLKAIGRSDVFLKLALFKKAVILVCIFIGFRFGIYGLIWAQGVSSLINVSVNLSYTRKFTNYKLLDQILDIVKPIPLILLPIVLMTAVQHYCLVDWAMFTRLSVLWIIGGLTYLAVNEIVKLNAYLELKSILVNVLKR